MAPVDKVTIWHEDQRVLPEVIPSFPSFATGLREGLFPERRNEKPEHIRPEWRIPLKPVVQLDRTGCGIASVAAIAGVSYQEAKHAASSLGIFVDDEALWSETTHVRSLLFHFGLKAHPEEIPFSTWEFLTDLALLSIKWKMRDGSSGWHWVVFVRDGKNSFVLDSKNGLRTNIRRDFGRMHPKWYIPVSVDGFLPKKS